MSLRRKPALPICYRNQTYQAKHQRKIETVKNREEKARIEAEKKAQAIKTANMMREAARIQAEKDHIEMIRKQKEEARKKRLEEEEDVDVDALAGGDSDDEGD